MSEKKKLVDCTEEELTGLPLSGIGAAQPVTKEDLERVAQQLEDQPFPEPSLQTAEKLDRMTYTIKAIMDWRGECRHINPTHSVEGDEVTITCAECGWQAQMSKLAFEEMKEWGEVLEVLEGHQLITSLIPDKPSKIVRVGLEDLDPEERHQLEKEALERAIWERAKQGKGATLEQALRCFADPSNWYTLHAPRTGEERGEGRKGEPYCHWAWKGMNRPPYELAFHALRQMEKDKKE